MSAFFLSVILLIICSATVQAKVIHVPGDSTTIQGGINGASTGDTVMVHPGTYYEHDIDFLGKAITVMGTDPEDSAVVAATVVDGDSLGSVIVFQSNEDSTSVLTGLTITGGYNSSYGGGINCAGASSPSIIKNIIRGNAAYSGGGIKCEDSPTVTDNIITGNWAELNGGGVYCNGTVLLTRNTIKENDAGNRGGGIYCYFSSSIISENVIADNSAYFGGGISLRNSYTIITQNTITRNWCGSGGSGIYLLQSSPLISDNTIIENTAGWDGGGISCSGSNSSPEIVSNTFTDNVASQFGGGISCKFSISLIISNNTFIGNLAGGNTAEWGGGGGILCHNSSPTISSNLFVGNMAIFGGGGIGIKFSSAPEIINNTLTENLADIGGGALWCYESSPPPTSNTIFWDNDAPAGREIYISYSTDPCTLAVGYSDVEGGQDSVFVQSGCTLDWGSGMIDADPLFTGTLYHLQSGSPCVDTGDSTILDACRPPGLGEARSDMGTFGGEENCRWGPNSAPVIISYPDTIAIAGLEYLYNVDAEDPEGDTLYFSLQISPSWLSIDSVTGVIRGIPLLDAIGDTTVTVFVEDGFGGLAFQTFTLVVLPQVDLTITPNGPTIIPIGGYLDFITHIQSNRENLVEGDYWLSAILPNSNEVFIPEGLLNLSNPLSGQIQPYDFIELDNWLFIPTRADTGSYSLIGRIGRYPDNIIDEESFGFRVVE
jgi:hypothetical protein